MRINQQHSRRRVFSATTLITLGAIILLGCSQNVVGQWATNGNDINNTNSGNVGVGTATPAYRVDILTSANLIARFRSSAAANNQVLFDAPTGYNANLTLQQGGVSQWYLGNRAANNRFSFIESTGQTEVFSILQNGNVGIGTTSPIYSLDVNGGVNAFRAKTSTGLSSDTIATFENSVGIQAIIRANGNVGIGTTSPNAKLVVASGNVGLGTNDIETWTAANSVIESLNTSIFFGQVTDLHLTSNAYHNAGWKYKSNGPTANYYLYNGAHGFRVAPSGTADTAFTWTDAMTINNLGKVGIGTTGPLGPLDVRLSPGNAYAGLLVNYSPTNATYLRAGSASVGDIHIGDVFTRNVLLGEAGGVKIGIGTTEPTTSLDVAGQIRSSTGGFKFPDGTVQTTAAGGGGSGTITGVTAGAGLTGGGTSGTVTVTNDDRGSSQNIFKNIANSAGATQFSAGSNSDSLRFEGSGGTIVSFDQGAKKVIIDSANIISSQWATNGASINYASGNVGIGTNSPTTKLHVVGDGKVTGNLTVDGNIAAKYQDVAEWVPASVQILAGTVVVLDSTKSNHVTLSTQSYDTRVAGVISEQPGIVLGERGDNKVLVATTGRVRVKVDASRAPIRIGDLLVASDKEGMAMKSQPIMIGGVEIHRPGTLIGKALEPLEKGTGEILVLLSLQ